MDQKPARVRIVDAAHELTLGTGLARTTAKEIGRAAGCSEAALYKYFTSKEEIFVTVLGGRMPRLGPLLSGLEAGEGALEQNLTETARQAVLFYQQSFPVLASLYAEPRLKRRHEGARREMGTGPTSPSRTSTPTCAPDSWPAASAPGPTPTRPPHRCWAPVPSAPSPTRRAGPRRPWTTPPRPSHAPC